MLDCQNTICYFCGYSRVLFGWLSTFGGFYTVDREISQSEVSGAKIGLKLDWFLFDIKIGFCYGNACSTETNGYRVFFRFDGRKELEMRSCF